MTYWHVNTGRMRALATGKVTWVDTDTGEAETEYMGWRDRWTLFGVHSHNWRWVDRMGRMRCGCTRNPVTRRMALIAMDCPEHGISWSELKGCDDDCDCDR